MSGGKPIRYVVIHADGTIEVEVAEVTNDLVHDTLGGDFEAIQPTDVDVTLLVATEGKRMGLPYNKLATKVARSRLRPSDFVVGGSIVAGPPDEEGELRGISDEALAAIREANEA